MKFRLVFRDWENHNYKSIYNDPEIGMDLTSGQFHSGTTFHCDIDLDDEDSLELANAINAGYRPIVEIQGYEDAK